jgi:translation initiation factor IF-2
MSDNDGKKTLGLRGGSRSGNVKQSFSHGRTKNVVVETKRKRVVVPKPGAGKPAGGSAGGQPGGSGARRPAGISDAEMQRRLKQARLQSVKPLKRRVPKSAIACALKKSKKNASSARQKKPPAAKQKKKNALSEKLKMQLSERQPLKRLLPYGQSKNRQVLRRLGHHLHHDQRPPQHLVRTIANGKIAVGINVDVAMIVVAGRES